MCATETAWGGIQMLLACTLFTVDEMLYVTSLHLPARAMSGDPAREVRPLWYPVSTVRRADSTSDRSPSDGMKGRMSGRPSFTIPFINLTSTADGVLLDIRHQRSRVR